jgi:class 3 adenylate cyclase
VAAIAVGRRGQQPESRTERGKPYPKQDGCCNHGEVTVGASPLPSGFVTFVFTDIEGSTRLLRRLGDGYVEVLDRHHTLLRRAWAAHGGHEINTEGDSFFVAFDRVRDAARACARGQRALQSQRWPEGVRVRVRMGVHVGLAAPVGSEYIALAVHQASRVSAVAHGGQVVLSEQAADEEGARDVGLAALGRYRVRDFERPVRLFQLVGPGLPSKFPAVRAVPADQHNLAVPLTRLIGRDRDAAGLEAALNEHRLLTVVGTGGVGKSRLLTEVGLRVATSWPSGVWLVDCSPLEDSDMVSSSLGGSHRSPPPAPSG